MADPNAGKAGIDDESDDENYSRPPKVRMRFVEQDEYVREQGIHGLKLETIDLSSEQTLAKLKKHMRKVHGKKLKSNAT